MNKKVFQSKFLSSRPSLLSSTSPWIILMATGLWLGQASHLQAMDEITEKSVSRQQRRIASQSNNPPSLQKFSENEHLSDRLKQIKVDAKDLDKIDAEKIEQCKEILKCSKEDCIFLEGFGEITFNELIISEKDKGGGFSGAIVPSPIIKNGKKIVVKQFEKIEHGIKELLESLVAWELNPVPAMLKMARIYDAAYCTSGSEECFGIIMECANGSDIDKCLGTALEENAVKACAEYLAIFHIKNSQNLKEPINRKKYISHAATFSNTLSQNLLNDDNLSNNEEEEKKKLKLLSLEIANQLKDLNDEEVKSNNIIQLLFPEKQESFISLAEKIHQNFKNNAEEIFRLLDPSNIKKLANYYLTITHGDAHGKNFFYEHLLTENNQEILLNSFYRITMIDYASIIRTYEGIGDPAEDVGRFLGSLWEWAAQKNKDYETIFILQQACIESYLKIIEDRKIFKTEKNFKEFQRIFKENCNFFKLRFYRVIFNSNQDQKVKLNILESWLRENDDLVKSLQKNTPLISCVAEEPELLLWKKVDGRTQYHHLPTPIEEFIESAAKESNISYLAHLRKMLADTGNVTLSSTAAIAGMGGVGKSTLALAYAHEALANNAYDLIYWIQCGTEFSLLKGYRELLLKIGISTDMGAPIRNVKDPQRIIELVKQRVPRVGRSLLIYDNVSDSDFLEGITPQENTDILITSRSQEGWKCALPMSVFRLEDSVNYLLGITGLEKTDPNKKIAGELANKLYHFPLALAHVAHYLKLVGGDKISPDHFEQYLKDFKKDESIRHFQENINNLTENQSKINYKHLIARTLNISKKYLEEHGIFKPAEELLSYCSYLDDDSIPKEIFLEYWPNQSKEDVGKVLEKLSALSLIKSGQSQATFSIHQLLQLVIRDEQESISTQQHQGGFSSIVPTFNILFEKKLYAMELVDKLLNYLPHMLKLLEHSGRLKVFSEEIERLAWSGKILLFREKNIMPELMLSTRSRNLIASHVLKYTCTKENNITKLIKDSQDLSSQMVKGKDKKIPLLLKWDTELSKFFLKNESIPYWLTKIAEQGHPTIQMIVANIYGINTDMKSALIWWEKAAQKGDTLALFNLGTMHFFGLGVKQNYEAALKYYTTAAGKGDVVSQATLGDRYFEGLGVKQNYEEALKWYKMAAPQGDEIAQFNLGVLYAQGQGVQKDETESIKWFSLAASQGNVAILLMLGNMYWDGQGFNQNYSKALGWFTKAAETGDVFSQYNLGMIYFVGKGIEQNYVEAVKWFKKAAEQGDADAQGMLGAMYAEGQGVKQSYKEAIKWFTKAAQQGDVKVQVLLGKIYSEGKWVAKNHAKAIEWFTEAAKQGNAEALIEDANALSWLIEAAEQGNSKALQILIKTAQHGAVQSQLAVSKIYSLGLGVEEDDDEASYWCAMAAKQGFVEAQYMLDYMYAEGLWVAKNDSEALKGQKKIAQQENTKKGSVPLSEYLIEEADKRYELAGDSTLAKQLQEEEDILESAFQDLLPDSKTIFENLKAELMQQIPINSSQPSTVSSQPIVFEKKKDFSTVTTQPQPQFFTNIGEKIKNPNLNISCDFENEENIKNALQGDKYMSAAIQNSEEGNIPLAVHLAAEANKKYELAEDSKLAKQLQEEDILDTVLQEFCTLNPINKI